jgi:hypothetical protein
VAAPFLTPQVRRLAAKHRLAASSVVPVASGYELVLRPYETRFSRPANVICSKGDR